MDYLTLAQTVRREAGISGLGPTSVKNQTGEMLRVVNWTAEAWRKVQLARKTWKWMRATASTTTVAGTYEYAPTGANFGLTRWARWINDSFYIADAAIGSSDSTPLLYMPYRDFRPMFLVGSMQQGRPMYVSFSPGGNVLLAPSPDREFTLSCEYYKSAQTLVENTDVPEMPADYHMAIVYRALMMYGRYEAAAEIYADAENNFNEEMERLEFDQLEHVAISDETLVW